MRDLERRDDTGGDSGGATGGVHGGGVACGGAPAAGRAAAVFAAGAFPHSAQPSFRFSPVRTLPPSTYASYYYYYGPLSFICKFVYIFFFPDNCFRK